MNLYIRFFWNIIKNLIFKRPLGLNDESLLSMRVLPTDLDLNMHMNNGRYLTIMDIARTEYLIRTDLYKIFYKEKLGGVTGGVHITFLKELNLFDKYTLKTRTLHWDDMWIYIEHQFLKDGIITAHAVAKVTFTKNRKRVSPDEVVKLLNKDVQKPLAPKYLDELITGETDMIDLVKDHNRHHREASKH